MVEDTQVFDNVSPTICKLRWKKEEEIDETCKHVKAQKRDKEAQFQLFT